MSRRDNQKPDALAIRDKNPELLPAAYVASLILFVARGIILIVAPYKRMARLLIEDVTLTRTTRSLGVRLRGGATR